ncbi:MAG: exodeoxyribonuclease III [Myxococcales bacterium]|nr:exodeoxyribonuclease III [Myxococcales bacterium]
MRLASWNVNSIRARFELVVEWLREHQPDALCLQETKVADHEFPTETFQRLGYEVARCGQRTYNGVAILSRHPIEDVQVGLVGAEPDDDKRLIAGTVAGVRLLSAYVPNGKALDSPSYEEKLRWLERLRETLDRRYRPQQELLLCGDFNIARDERDVFEPERMQGQLFFSAAEHAALERVLAFGLVDAFREVEPEGQHFSWWDYRAGAFRRNRGLRIDYAFLTEPLARRLAGCWMDKAARAKDKPSDHVPVVVDLR